jgi:hypothetical protein
MKTEAFSRVISPYLDQDWPEEFQDSSEALAAAAASEPEEMFGNVCREIDDILASDLNEDDLEKIIRDQAGCYFAPESEGHTYRSWLKEVRAALLC